MNFSDEEIQKAQAILSTIPGKHIGWCHDLRNHFGYQDVFFESADCVGFLDLGRVLETFEKDALLLEKEFDVLISRVIDPEIPDWPVPAARISKRVADIIIPKMIEKGYKVLFADPIKEDKQERLF